MSLPTPEPSSTALVTGASSGIGAELARELARRGHGLTLVARREERLRALADELSSAHGVRAEVLTCDLTDHEARAALPDRVRELGLDVDILVNNAGFGTGGRFQDSPVDDEIRQVRILCEAVVALTGYFLPPMVQRRRGAILNVASTAGMQPMPFSAGYGAAKAHALSLSEALHTELRPVGIAVTALCPGPVETEFFENAERSPIDDAVPRFAWTDVRVVARAGIDGLAANRRVVVPGLPFKVAAAGSQFMPHGIKLPMLRRFFGRVT